MQRYVDSYGDTLVPVAYVDESGFALGKWLIRIKEKYHKGVLEPHKIVVLNNLGMDWGNLLSARTVIYWYTMFEQARQYFEENGNINVASNYVTKDGKKLGGWIAPQRRIYKRKLSIPTSMMKNG